jgi:hypothetical protein
MHLEYTIDGNRLRFGQHDYIAEATQSFERLVSENDRLEYAAVYEGSFSTAFGDGTLVAIRTNDGEWITSENGFAEPDWWSTVTSDVQSWLLAHPGEPLTADVVVAVAHARGVGPTAAGFVNGTEPAKSILLDKRTIDWIRARAVQQNF